MNKSNIRSITIAAVTLMSLGVVSCGQDDESTGKAVKLNLSFDAFSSEGTALTAESTVSEATFCFKRLRFKAADVESDEKSDDESAENIDFDLGEITLSEGGTSLGEVSVAEGSYKRVEFDFDKKCEGGFSVKVTNSHGTFQTTDRVKIKFRGDFEASDSNSEVGLAVDTILAALEGVTADGEIKDAIGDPSGILKTKGASGKGDQDKESKTKSDKKTEEAG